MVSELPVQDSGPAPSEVASLPVGSPVQYFSRSLGNWIPAKVMGLRPGQRMYELDVQPMATFQQVRALPPETKVYYFSSSQRRWIPAVVKGYNEFRAVYELDVHVAANPAMMRIRQASEHQPVSSPTYNTAAASIASATPHSLNSSTGRHENSQQTQRQCRKSTTVAEPDPYRFNCPLCLLEMNLEEGVCLDCDHKLCTNCFVGYCSSKIADGKVMENELVCPAIREGTEMCRKAITVEQVRGNVDSVVFDKLCSLRLANWKPPEEDGILVRCPSPDCCSFLVSSRDAEMACPKCRTVLCCRCCRPVHTGESCEEHAQRLRAAPTSEADRKFEEIVASQGWTRCPSCGTPTVHEQGCYFMQCQSDKCRGEVHFCYLCGDMLDGKDHMPGRSLGHFPRGPYNMECVNVTEEQYREVLKRQDPPQESFTGAPLMNLVEGARRFLEV